MKEYGLLGYPLGHSFSRAFFLEKFAREGIDADYLNFEVPSAEMLLQVIQEHPNLQGLNVTIPHKKAVIPLLDELSDEARAIGAVNVIRITREPVDSVPDSSSSESPRHYLKGFNSDIIGFMESIRPLLQPHHRRALVLGTGGASKAICRGLEKLGLEWRYVSRQRQLPSASECPSSKRPSDSVLGGLPAESSPFSYSDITPSLLADYTVIVNCTPLGMHPNVDTAPPLPYAALSPRHLLYDLVYNPEVTEFMRQGRRFGATVKGGLEMLHRQAVASWEFWNGKD
jgi:shikimate dehydrogenase